MDIVIYTNPGVLLHKLRPDMDCYWEVRGFPKKIKIGNKIWFVTEQMIQGYFLCSGFDFGPDMKPRVEFKSKSWRWLDEYPVQSWHHPKPFRGFRYRWWEEE